MAMRRMKSPYTLPPGDDIFFPPHQFTQFRNYDNEFTLQQPGWQNGFYDNFPQATSPPYGLHENQSSIFVDTPNCTYSHDTILQPDTGSPNENFNQHDYWDGAAEPFPISLPTEEDSEHTEGNEIHQRNFSVARNNSFGGFVSHPRLMVTNFGSVTIRLSNFVKIDLTPAGAICVHNTVGGCLAAVNSVGNKSCVIHPNSRVFQEGMNVHILTDGNRMIKICRKGIIFSSSQHSLAYLVDESGTKTTAEKFMNLSSYDVLADVFYNDIKENCLEECYDMISKSIHNISPIGEETWIIDGARIFQDRKGDVTVASNSRQRIITTSPALRKISLNTPAIDVNTNSSLKHYLTVRKSNRIVTSGYCGLTVQIGSQKSGFGRNGKLVLF
ncbi:uncharacterized protein LOC118186579 [Stegodyphus dumicola]|uniref:uncharacterized protein LOC118186579 n=1 Tax=Stegodyphus dumicola TaxID=202533 RepID=UPI0015B34C94|nr:uncharacterized protein LOC118186579 [Stegodyphus dumicola]